MFFWKASAFSDQSREGEEDAWPLWTKFAGDRPLNYRFLEDELSDFYAADQKIGSIITYFAVISLIISCLGLLGLISFVTEQKTKEIGIRKVLGATLSTIVKLISKEFFILVVIGNIIAWPIGYYTVNKWIQDFAYRIDLKPWIFLFASFIVLIITMLTISYQTIKAGRMNPVDSLRYE